MSIIEVRGVTHRYGVHTALSDLDLSVPSGSLYALLGPNGAGKSTLLQILAGLRRPTEGEVTVLGKDVRDLNAWDRVSIGYVAENQRLPSWMTLRQLEAFLAPLYPTWDHALAQKLRTRFRLELHRTIGTLSKGERMKVALYSSLAPRPKLLLMDEPFSGVDVSVKDELVRGLLESAGSEGWTIVVSSHDIAEIELLADWVGFLDCGRLIVSESMESLQGRFQRVDAVAPEGAMIATGDDWLMVERAGRHISFITQNGAENFSAHSRLGFPAATHVDVRPASLREIFVALASLRQDDSGLLELAR